MGKAVSVESRLLKWRGLAWADQCRSVCVWRALGSCQCWSANHVAYVLLALCDLLASLYCTTVSNECVRIWVRRHSSLTWRCCFALINAICSCDWLFDWLTDWLNDWWTNQNNRVAFRFLLFCDYLDFDSGYVSCFSVVVLQVFFSLSGTSSWRHYLEIRRHFGGQCECRQNGDGRSAACEWRRSAERVRVTPKMGVYVLRALS